MSTRPTRQSLTVLVNAVLIASTVCASENDVKNRLLSAGNTNVSCVLPVMSKSEVPVIDGRMTEEEWLKSDKFAGFSKSKSGLVGCSGYTYLGTDGENLYVGVRTATPNLDPGGGMVTKCTKHDGSVYNDDSVEIMINSDSNPDHTYHLILNSKEVIYDSKVVYSLNTEDTEWNIKDMKVGSLAESGWWTLEVKIPFTQIGNPKKQLKLNVARNWAEMGQSAIVEAAPHIDRSCMINVRWAENVPAFKINSLGNPCEGDWNVELQAAALPAGSKYIIGALLTKRSYPVVNGKVSPEVSEEKYVEKTVENNQTTSLKLETDDKNIRSLCVILMDAVTRDVLFLRALNGQKGETIGRFPSTLSFTLGENSRGSCFYYPGFNKARLDMTLPASFKAKVNVAGPEGFKESVLAQEAGNRRHRAVIPTGAIPGEYYFSFELLQDNKPFKQFTNVFFLTKRKFEWENNKYGKDRIILPPFTPVKQKGNELSILLRKYKFNPQGLLDSIIAKDREILASPMYFECVMDGKAQSWSGTVKNITVRDNGYDAIWEATATSTGGIKLNTESLLEYDGFTWNKVKLTGVAGKKIDKLTMIVPLQQEETTLFHAVADIIRFNPAGFLPQGEGEIWNSDKLTRERIPSYAVPYIWLGGIERGFSFFIDSTYGFKLNKEKPAVRIIREKGQIRLEVDIINRSVLLKDGHSFEYGIHCTPVKPKELSWRKWQYNNGETIPGMENIFNLQPFNLGFANEWDKFPINNDYGLFEATLKYITDPSEKNRQTAISEYERWKQLYDHELEKEFVNYKSEYDKDQPYIVYWQNHREYYNKIILGSHSKPMLPCLYTDTYLVTHYRDAPDYFKAEWSVNPICYVMALRSYNTPSNLDYLIYGYYLQLKHGLGGVYLDDMFVTACDKPDLLAKIDDEGEVHFPMRILAMRELVKRIAVMQHQFKFKPRHLQIHMTNGLLVPCFSFATCQLGWEEKYGEEDFQDRFSKGNILAMDIGSQVGCDSVVLDGIYRRTTPIEKWMSQRFPEITRTQVAVTLPYGIKIKQRHVGKEDERDFGVYWPVLEKAYGILSKFGHYCEDCDFIPAGNDDGAITTDNKNIAIASYRRPGKTLVILGNFGDQANLQLKLDQSKLKLPIGYRVWNAETGAELKNGELYLKKHDFAMLLAGEVFDADAR